MPAPPSPVPRPPSSTGRRLLPREERHAQILRAAATAFARAGFAGTSMDDVAAEAGVTRLIVYRHFPSKDGLYRAVLDEVAGRLGERFEVGRLSPDELRRGFATRTVLEVARQQPDAFRLLMVHAAREPAFAAVAERFHQQGVEITEALIGDAFADAAMRTWACRIVTRYVIDGVLEWLAVGDPARDEQFVAIATTGLAALVGAWIGGG